jgi:hypothetical protein
MHIGNAAKDPAEALRMKEKNGLCTTGGKQLLFPSITANGYMIFKARHLYVFIFR